MVDDTNPQQDGSTEDSGLHGMGEPELPRDHRGTEGPQIV